MKMVLIRLCRWRVVEDGSPLMFVDLHPLSYTLLLLEFTLMGYLLLLSLWFDGSLLVVAQSKGFCGYHL